GLQPEATGPQPPPTRMEQAGETALDVLEFFGDTARMTVATGPIGGIETAGTAAAEAVGLAGVGRALTRSAAGRWIGRQFGRLGSAVDELVGNALRRTGASSEATERLINEANHVFGPKSLERHNLGGVLNAFDGDRV